MHRVPVVLALAIALAGCSASSSQPPGAGATLAPSVGAPADPIPPVPDPKNLASTPPCQLLTPAQLTANRIDLPSQPKDVLDAPGCQWNDKAHTREIAVFVDIGADVLHNVYAQRANYPVFEITQVSGHPAIRTKNLVNGTSCFMQVAASRTQTLNLDFTSLGDGLEEPCGPAKALAEDVMANLPPLGG